MQLIIELEKMNNERIIAGLTGSRNQIVRGMDFRFELP
jgi:hypothetical protein